MSTTAPYRPDICTCTPGRTCPACRQWAHREDTPRRSAAYALGGLKMKLQIQLKRLPHEQAHLAVLQAAGRPDDAEWQRLKKRQYETCQRVEASIATLRMKIDVALAARGNGG